MKGFLLGNNGDFVNALNTTNKNNPRKKSNEPISGTPINHWSPTAEGMIILKKSI